VKIYKKCINLYTTSLMFVLKKIWELWYFALKYKEPSWSWSYGN